MAELSREQSINVAFVTLADSLIADFDLIDMLHTLAEVCADVLDVKATGLVLADEAGDLQLLASTSEQADFVEVMQINAGEGPCIRSFRTGVVVSVADIEKSGDEWPVFQSAALQQGFRSVHALPMRLRGQVLGALNLFGAEVGELNTADASVAQALADVATIGILQERSIRETGIVTEQLQRALESRIIIEQAKGVLSVVGNMGVDQAFGLMRDYARRNNITLRAVAEGVTARTLDILGSSTGQPSSTGAATASAPPRNTA